MMLKIVLTFLLLIIALALLAGPGVRRAIMRILGIPKR